MSYCGFKIALFAVLTIYVCSSLQLMLHPSSQTRHLWLCPKCCIHLCEIVLAVQFRKSVTHKIKIDRPLRLTGLKSTDLLFRHKFGNWQNPHKCQQVLPICLIHHRKMSEIKCHLFSSYQQFGIVTLLLWVYSDRHTKL